jgi:hypothetical protein
MTRELTGWPHVGAGLATTLVVVGVFGAAALAVAWTAPKPPKQQQPELRIPERAGPRLVTFPSRDK